MVYPPGAGVMRLPFVARSTLEAERQIVAILHDELRLLNQRLDKAHAQLHEANQTAIRMTKEGWTPPPPLVEAPESDDLPDMVTDALDGLGLPMSARAQDEQLLRRWIQDGMPVEKALQRLIEGSN